MLKVILLISIYIISYISILKIIKKNNLTLLKNLLSFTNSSLNAFI